MERDIDSIYPGRMTDKYKINESRNMEVVLSNLLKSSVSYQLQLIL